MPRRQWKLRIRHILDAIDKIRVYTAGMSLEAFSANHLVLGAAGSRRTGGTTRGAVLALAGSIVGGLMGIGLPVPLMGPLLGVCLGVFAGALLGNLWAGRKLFQSLAAGCGAAIGHFWGTILKLAIGAIIAVMLAIAAFV